MSLVMGQIIGTPVYFNEFMSRRKAIKSNDAIIMHPVDVGLMLLSESKGDYKEVFSSIGVNRFSLDACFEYALNQVLK